MRLSDDAKRRIRGNDPEWAVRWWRHYDQWRRDIIGPDAFNGWVYVIQGRKNGPVKIGFTNGDVEARLASLQTGSPHKLSVLTQIRGCRRCEHQLHDMFSMWRMEGEWFSGKAFGLQELIDELNTRLPV